MNILPGGEYLEPNEIKNYWVFLRRRCTAKPGVEDILGCQILLGLGRVKN
ncbi:MAG: hypothetical protein HOJ58_01510 [Chloroflexi bacterium]|jgi:hypothetical protein|nr:hypothetical protein [Chloroflexota bacterium]